MMKLVHYITLNGLIVFRSTDIESLISTLIYLRDKNPFLKYKLLTIQYG